jgi:hypothetical protein
MALVRDNFLARNSPKVTAGLMCPPVEEHVTDISGALSCPNNDIVWSYLLKDKHVFFEFLHGPDIAHDIQK